MLSLLLIHFVEVLPAVIEMIVGSERDLAMNYKRPIVFWPQDQPELAHAVEQ